VPSNEVKVGGGSFSGCRNAFAAIDASAGVINVGGESGNGSAPFDLPDYLIGKLRRWRGQGHNVIEIFRQDNDHPNCARPSIDLEAD
jgi:hypothetical protein